MRGAVLAGGLASRFNQRPKGLELLGGERILDRISRTIENSIGDRPVLIADPAIAARWQPDLEVIGDEIPGCGSLGGLYTALTLGTGPVLVVAWDMPFVGVDLLRGLIEKASGYDAFMPESTGPLGVEPWCAVYEPRCRAAIRHQMDEGDFRATAFHGAVRVGTLALQTVAAFGNPDVLFFNVNTEADLAKARAMWRHGRQQSIDG